VLNREQIRPNAFWSAVLWLMSPPVAMLAWSAFIGAPGGARGTACRARTAASISGVPPVVNAAGRSKCCDL